MALTGEQVAQLLYGAGFRDQDLVNMVAIGHRESRYEPSAHRTDNPGGATGDFGLFQINAINLSFLQREIGITSMAQLLDPVTNARAAFALFQNAGLAPWRDGAGGFNAAGDPMYGTNAGAASTAVQNASNQGMLGATAFTGTNTPSATGGAMPASASGGPFRLPSDAVLYNNGLALFAVFDVGGVKISYDVTWFDGSVDLAGLNQNVVTAEEWASFGTVHAGNAEELRGLEVQHPTFRAFWDQILNQVMGQNNPARTDPGVLAVIAQLAGRPDMTPAELQNLLQGTQWYQDRTTSELEWNGLAEGEKVRRRDEMAARMVQTWFQFTGESVSTSDPRIVNYLEDLASGKRGIGSWTEDTVKAAAVTNGESPYSRQVRDEAEAQRARGVDVENTAQRVRDLARRWGVQFPPSNFQDWATQIAEKTMSEADVLKIFQDQAAVLYPWKDPTMETSTAAGQWTAAYERIMERPGDLMNTQVQAALTAGTPVWQFEQDLKKSSGWLQTRNARDEIFSTMSEAGRRLGFE
jgi:hypothetical protein